MLHTGNYLFGHLLGAGVGGVISEKVNNKVVLRGKMKKVHGD